MLPSTARKTFCRAVLAAFRRPAWIALALLVGCLAGLSEAATYYTLQASAGSGGTISPAGAVKVVRGSKRTFRVTPITNYRIKDVLVNGISVGAPSSYTFQKIRADQTIAVTFVPKKVAVIASTGPNGTISPAGQVRVPYGGSKTFTITPAPGYRIGDVQVDGVSVGGVTSYTFADIKKNHAITPTFVSTAGQQTLVWDANTEPTLAGYRIHLGLASRSYDQRFEVGKATQYTLTNLEVGKTYYAAATAYDGNGVESGFSNEVCFTVTRETALDRAPQEVAAASPASRGKTAQTSHQPAATGPEAGASRQSPPAPKPLIVVGLGSHPEGEGILDLLAVNGSRELPIVIDWPEYYAHNGETRVATGDIDGDGRDEIVVGFDTVPGIPDLPGGLFQVLDHDFAPLAWGKIRWPEYNRANGATRPTVGDLDGDGKAEIIVGLGPGGHGKCEVFGLEGAKLVHKAWLSLDWQDYNVAGGETRPASGDLDGDGKAEVVVGLAAVPGDGAMPGGVFKVFGNDLIPLGWGRTAWPEYNQLKGETWPAVGDVNGDGQGEIILGLGPRGGGRFEIAIYNFVAQSVSHQAWKRLPWSDYNETFGETRPTARSLDGDPAAEILVGLGRGGAGILHLFDDSASNYAPLGSIQGARPEYNVANGETWPAIFLQRP